MSRRRPRTACESRRVRELRSQRDRGSSLVLAMVMMLMGAMMVLPVMRYTMTVLKSGHVRSDTADRTEAVKGGLRVALYDPVALYQECVLSGRTTARQLAVPPGLDIVSWCTTTKDALQDVPSEQRYALTTTQVGSEAAIPAPYAGDPARPELAGTMSPTWCTSMNQADVNMRLPCGKPYPSNGSATTNQWQLDSSVTSAGSKVFTPRLPTFSNSLAYAAGYMMPPGDNGEQCRVYFPGKYTDDVVLTDNIPTYFVSGIYYFEKAVRISGNANVVAGAGSIPSCVESDAVAVADAINAPFDAYSNGVGATFVFGLNGRLVIDNVAPAGGAGTSFKMNRRLVDKTDPDVVLNDISIMSVNGVLTGSVTSPLDIPGRLNVPVSGVLNGNTVDPDPYTHFYKASTLISQATAPVHCNLPLTSVTAACPIIDIALTATSKLDVKIPGYVSVPQGTVSLSVGAGAEVNKNISFGGGVLTAQIAVTGTPPAAFQMGLLNPVVQKTFKIVTETLSGSPKIRSTALVQVNETGGNAINSWVIETI
jgi:hypothetical protein